MIDITADAIDLGLSQIGKHDLGNARGFFFTTEAQSHRATENDKSRLIFSVSLCLCGELGLFQDATGLAHCRDALFQNIDRDIGLFLRYHQRRAYPHRARPAPQE